MRVICVDDERPILENFRSKAKNLAEIESLKLFQSANEAIACLWPDRPTDENTLTLYRVTFHRLMEKLKAAGIEHIIGSEGRKRYIHTEQVDCDLYRLLSENKFDLQNYSGEYMKEYSWAESRNAQLSSLKSAGRIPNKKTV